MSNGLRVGEVNEPRAVSIASTLEVVEPREGYVSAAEQWDREGPGWGGIEFASPSADWDAGNASKLQERLIRCLDIFGALGLFIITLPVMLVTSCLIKILSPGPVLYKQERVGKGGKRFILYKFRSMVVDAEKHVGPVWATPDDDRVTLIGKFLRASRIDELPQLINVLKGDMSLVGPRPERPFFVEQHEALRGVRLAVKPGLTGFAQIRALYDLKPSNKLRYDALYIQKRSVLLNLYILVMTIPVVLRKTGW